MTDKWTDSHYNFNVELTDKEKEQGYIKLDPYRLYGEWGLHHVDMYGILFHCTKTISRFGQKNSQEREIRALYAQIKRLAELENVNLEER